MSTTSNCHCHGGSFTPSFVFLLESVVRNSRERGLTGMSGNLADFVQDTGRERPVPVWTTIADSAIALPATRERNATSLQVSFGTITSSDCAADRPRQQRRSPWLVSSPRSMAAESAAAKRRTEREAGSVVRLPVPASERESDDSLVHEWRFRFPLSRAPDDRHCSPLQSENRGGGGAISLTQSTRISRWPLDPIRVAYTTVNRRKPQSHSHNRDGERARAHRDQPHSGLSQDSSEDPTTRREAGCESGVDRRPKKQILLDPCAATRCEHERVGDVRRVVFHENHASRRRFATKKFKKKNKIRPKRHRRNSTERRPAREPRMRSSPFHRPVPPPLLSAGPLSRGA